MGELIAHDKMGELTNGVNPKVGIELDKDLSNKMEPKFASGHFAFRRARALSPSPAAGVRAAAAAASTGGWMRRE